MEALAHVCYMALALLYSTATDYGQLSIHAYTYSEYSEELGVKKIKLLAKTLEF